MKTFLFSLAMLMLGAVCYADYAMLTVSPYAAGTTCSFMGGSPGRIGLGVSQFNPNPSYTRIFVLGGVGTYKNYSSRAFGVSEVHITCFSEADNTTIKYVKLGFNNSITTYFPITNKVLFAQ
jgi:hypothetical protein